MMDQSNYEERLNGFPKMNFTPEELGVIDYDTFERHMIDLEQAIKTVTVSQDGKYTGTMCGVPQDVTFAVKMYFELLTHIFGIKMNFIEGYSIIEAYVFLFDFGRKFHIGDIVNTAFKPDSEGYMPDISNYHKFYTYLCYIKAGTLYAPKCQYEMILNHVYVRTNTDNIYRVNHLGEKLYLEEEISA